MFETNFYLLIKSYRLSMRLADMMIQSISRAQGFLTIIAWDVKSRTEVEFVHAVSAGGSVKFLPAE